SNSVEVAVLVSFILAIICELIRHKGSKEVLADTEKFFTGMGNMISVVDLLVAASVFVAGLQSIGLIDTLHHTMDNIEAKGFDFVLPLIVVSVIALIVMLSGSGIALFFAMIPLIVPLADAERISPIPVSAPMGVV